MASASQSTNPLGAQVILDGGVPRTFTAKALETISGGYLVNTSGATNDVGSSVSSYATADLKVVGAQDAALFNGIALNNAGSNELVTVATRGDYLMRCGGIVSGGALVMHNGSGNIANWIETTTSGTVVYGLVGNTPVGRAKTTSASGTNLYALVSINA